MYNQCGGNKKNGKSNSLKHIENVIENCKQLIEIFKIDEKIANNILIAAVLHDIGRYFILDYKKYKKIIKHSKVSEKFARVYLNNKVELKDIEFICELIEKHGGEKERNFYQELFNFADAIDITKKRLLDDYEEGEKINVIYHIEEVLFGIKYNKLYINFITDENVTPEDLLKKSKMYNRILSSIKALAEIKNLEYQLFWNSEIFDDKMVVMTLKKQ